MDTTSMPKLFPDHHSWYLSTLSSMSHSPATPKLLYTYANSFHGFTAILTDSQLESLRQSPGFLSASPDRPLKLHTTHTPESLGLSPITGAWPTSGYGEDIIIGFVDTGIWPENPSFGDQGVGPVPSRWRGSCASMCNNKIIGARFFSKGLLANSLNGTHLSMDSPRDTSGHGTHTSSTAAGNFVNGASYFNYASGTAKGVAPHARIAMYKAVWTHGVYASDVVAAIDQAIEDGVDVLSLSLGFSLDDSYLHDDPIAVATFAAVEKHILVVASAGNDGPLPWSLMNGAPWLLTVGATTVDREFYGVLTLQNGVNITFSSLYPGKSLDVTLGIVSMDACDSITRLEKARDKLVVCRDQDNLGITSQVDNAISARLTAAVFITDSALSEFYMRSSFPAAFITQRDGETLLDYLKGSAGPPSPRLGKLEFQKTRVGTKPAPKVEGYSSRGPFLSCPIVLKPDITAPGTLVLASWPPKSSVAEVRSGPLFSTFNLMTGTSMASPHVAGSAALVKAVHPSWSPAAIKSALMTTAFSLDNTQTPIKDAATTDLPASPLAMGSGHVDPNKALDPGLVYDTTTQDYINLLCAMKYTPTQIKVITKKSILICKNSSNSDLNYPSFIAYLNREASATTFVKEFKRVVTNVGDERSSYMARVIGLEGLNVSVEPQSLLFTQKYQQLSYKLTLEGGRILKEDVIYGSLVWSDKSGKYSVRSPIVVTSLVQESLFGHKNKWKR